MDATPKPEKRRGRAKGPDTEPFTVMLQPHLAERAKDEPGGLSALLRECLEQRYAASQPPAEKD